MNDALKLASDYWPEIASFGIFLAGLVALAAAVAWVEGRLQNKEQI